MFIKLYEQILDYIRKEYKFLIFIFLSFIILTFKLPYYIDTPGGIIDISDRINTLDSFDLSGSLNFAYVSEMRATIPTFIIDKFNDDWDLVDMDDIVSDNESLNDSKIRDEIALRESVSNALYVGYSKSNVKFNVINNKVYVTGVYKDADTDLKVGDQIVGISGKTISSYDDLSFVRDKSVGDNISIDVINDGKSYVRRANLIEINGKSLIGVSISSVFDIDSDYTVNISHKARESGPSGGLMMALTVYSYLSGDDITDGRVVVGTGTIDREGRVGSIGGVKYKLIGAVRKGADLFIVPNGENYDEAIRVKEAKGYDIDIYGVDSFDDAIGVLKK